MKISGIYKITNTITNQIYIGSAIDFNYRKRRHLYKLRKNDHCNKKLQHSFCKYGESASIFSLIESCDKEILIQREQFYIDTLNPYFNICRIANSWFGVKHSKESLQKLSNTQKEYFKTHNVWNKGKIGIFSSASREKMRISQTGITPWNKGIARTAAEKLKMSVSKLGELNCRSIPVIQKALDGSFIKRWSAAREAARVLGINHRGILYTCKGIYKNSKGFIWEYENIKKIA